MSLPAVSKHLVVLERAGLIARGREAQWRPARLEGRPLRDVADWLDQYRQFWDERFERLDEYLNELQAKEKTHARRRAENASTDNRTTMTLPSDRSRR